MGRLTRYSRPNATQSAAQKISFAKMKMIFGIFVIFAVLATASAKKKGDDSLLSVLSKERQEMKELFRHDNRELREQDTKLQQENDQIRKMNKRLQKQMVKMREEKLQEENNAMKKENEKLKKEIKKLRHADRRQRDQIDGLELEKKIKDLIRQEDVVLETKKREPQTSNSSKVKEAISEVEITGGSAGATSFYAKVEEPDNAFIRGNTYPWTTGVDKKNKGIFPQMVWYDFGQGNAFVPARVSFRGRMNCETCQKQTPSVWEFVGSNDDVCSGSGNWTVLCQDLSDVVPQKQVETKFCDVNNSNPCASVEQKEYRCLGINVIRARHNYTSLSNVRMWKNLIQAGDE